MANAPVIKKIRSWTIPMFGNTHLFSYGVLVVSDGETTKECRTREEGPMTFITFKRKRYEVVNNGRLYQPGLALRPI